MALTPKLVAVDPTASPLGPIAEWGPGVVESEIGGAVGEVGEPGVGGVVGEDGESEPGGVVGEDGESEVGVEVGESEVGGADGAGESGASGDGGAVPGTEPGSRYCSSCKSS